MRFVGVGGNHIHRDRRRFVLREDDARQRFFGGKIVAKALEVIRLRVRQGLEERRVVTRPNRIQFPLTIISAMTRSRRRPSVRARRSRWR